MSDEAAPAKRGRKANADKAADKNDKAASEAKKRPKKDTTAKTDGDSNDEGAVPIKRGRGRPKGSTKKKNNASGGTAPSVKPKTKGTGRRGRPKKEDKSSAEEDADENEEDEAGDEEDD